MSDLTASLRSISSRLLPFFLILLFCGSAFVIGEQYPVTRFPMYDKFPDHTFYVYVGDRDGNPVPIHKLTGINTSKLKKPYDKELNRTRKKLKKRKLELTADERRTAGETALRNVYQSAPEAGREALEQLAPLKLFHVWILSKDGKSAEQPPELVAEFTPEK